MLRTEIELIISGIGFAIDNGCTQVITLSVAFQACALLSSRFIFSANWSSCPLACSFDRRESILEVIQMA
jgi:hypothetical protein